MTIAMHWDDDAHSLKPGARQGQYSGMPANIAFRVTCKTGEKGHLVSYDGAARSISLPACQ